MESEIKTSVGEPWVRELASIYPLVDTSPSEENRLENVLPPGCNSVQAGVSPSGNAESDSEVELESPMHPDRTLTRAAAFRPTGVAFQILVLSLLEQVACEIQEAFGIEVTRGFLELPNGEAYCTLVATCLPKDPKELHVQLQNAAMEGICRRMGRSRGVCLLGYKAMPFKPKKPHGSFTGTFASVPSTKRGVCRRLYASGRCQRGCKFEHPDTKVHLDFTFASPSAAIQKNIISI